MKKTEITFGRKTVRVPSTHRVALTMDNVYGNIVGTGQTDVILTEMVKDLRRYCRLTGRDFNLLISQGLV